MAVNGSTATRAKRNGATGAKRPAQQQHGGGFDLDKLVDTIKDIVDGRSETPTQEHEPLKDVPRWEESREYEGVIRTYQLGMQLALALFAGGLLILAVHTLGIPSPLRFYLGGGCWLAAAGSAMYSVSRWQRARVSFRDRQEAAARGDLTDAYDNLLTDGLDLKTLMKLNRRALNAYHVITKEQARDSYRNTQRAFMFGLGVVAVGAAGALAANGATAKISVATLSALGAALSGYISKTFLVTYRAALRQLNFYFEQPLINSYLLGAERVAEKMETDKREETYERIVKRVLESAGRPPVVTDGFHLSGRRAKADSGVASAT